MEALVVSGPAGVGKSSVAFEVSLQLQAIGAAHALIDTDELDRIYPVPDDLPALTERNLAAVWQGFAERGVQRLILVGVHLDRSVARCPLVRRGAGPRLALPHRHGLLGTGPECVSGTDPALASWKYNRRCPYRQRRSS